MPHEPQWESLQNDLTLALGKAVQFDAGSKAVYASDASNYRQVPIGAVVPKNMDDFMRGVEICRRHQAPGRTRGGGTAMSGQTVNHAVVFELSTFCDNILERGTEAGSAVVE